MSAQYEDFKADRNGRWQHERRHDDLQRGWGRFRAYLAGLTTEHWLLFLAGLLVGLILG